MDLEGSHAQHDTSVAPTSSMAVAHGSSLEAATELHAKLLFFFALQSLREGQINSIIYIPNVQQNLLVQ